METENKTIPGDADWGEDYREPRTPKWEAVAILAAVTAVMAWRSFREAFKELPTWLRETFAHVIALSVMGVMVFPEVRWWFVGAFALPASLSVFALGLTGFMEALDPSDAEDWFGKDSEFWGRRAFFFGTMSALIAMLAYLR